MDANRLTAVLCARVVGGVLFGSKGLQYQQLIGSGSVTLNLSDPIRRVGDSVETLRCPVRVGGNVMKIIAYEEFYRTMTSSGPPPKGGIMSVTKTPRESVLMSRHKTKQLGQSHRKSRWLPQLPNLKHKTSMTLSDLQIFL